MTKKIHEITPLRAALATDELEVQSTGGGASARVVASSLANLAVGGSDTQVQFNDDGAFGGHAGLTFNKTTAQLRVGPAESTLDAWLRNSVGGAVHVVGTQNASDVGLGVEMQGPDVYGLFFTTLAKGGSFASYGVAASAVAGAAATPRVVAVAASAGSNASGAATDAIALLADGGVLVAGGSITNQYGLKIDDQAKGSNNWAIKTGLGRVQFGDAVTLDSLTGTKFVKTDGSKNLVSVSPPSITGSRGGNAALASLLTQLATLGLIVDGTSA